MIRRKAWGAKPLTAYNWNIDPQYRTGIIIHHSVTPEGKSRQDVEATLRQIDDGDRREGYGGIGYNLAVDYAGRIYVARGINRIGAHAADANSRNYGICYIGDGRVRISQDAVKAIRRAVDRLQQHSGKKLRVYGHKDINPTACPGDKIYKLIKDGKFSVPYR